MSKFKFGQKVRIKKSYTSEPGLAGKTGVVRIPDRGGVGVEFEGWGQGHTFENHEIDSPDGWYFDAIELVAVPAKKKVARKKKKSAK